MIWSAPCWPQQACLCRPAAAVQLGSMSMSQLQAELDCSKAAYQSASKPPAFIGSESHAKPCVSNVCVCIARHIVSANTRSMCVNASHHLALFKLQAVLSTVGQPAVPRCASCVCSVVTHPLPLIWCVVLITKVMPSIARCRFRASERY